MAQERVEGDRGRFGELEKMIITNRVDPKLKADYLSRQAPNRRSRQADDESRPVRVRPRKEPVRKPRTARYTVLTVVYLAVCVGLVWTAWQGSTGYLATHGHGTKGIIYQTSCHKGSFPHLGKVCGGDFIPSDPAVLRQGVVIQHVTVYGGHATSSQLTVSRLSATGDAYQVDWNGWLWTGVAAIVLLVVFAGMTFWPGGVVTVSRRGLHLWSERHKLKKENRRAREAADRARRERREARAAERAAAEEADEADTDADQIDDGESDDAQADESETAAAELEEDSEAADQVDDESDDDADTDDEPDGDADNAEDAADEPAADSADDQDETDQDETDQGGDAKKG